MVSREVIFCKVKTAIEMFKTMYTISSEVYITPVLSSMHGTHVKHTFRHGPHLDSMMAQHVIIEKKYTCLVKSHCNDECTGSTRRLVSLKLLYFQFYI